MSDEICKHIREVNELKSGVEHVCEECIKTNSRWVHLRTCQTCGATLCCDSSPHKHMTRHYYATGHPVIASAERGERWLWCYSHELYVEY